MVAQGRGHFAQDRLNPENLSVDLLNRSLAAIWHVVVGDDLKGVANVMVQLPNPPQAIEHGLVTFLNVTQKLEDQQAHSDGNRGASQHERNPRKILLRHEPIEYSAG